MIKLKPLVWEQGQPIGGGWIDPLLVSINDLAEFAIVPDCKECEGKRFKLEINFSGGMWDCFCYDSIEQCQERANAWWKEKIEEAIVFKVPTLKKQKQPKIDSLIASRERLVNRIAEIEIQIRDLKNAAQ